MKRMIKKALENPISRRMGWALGLGGAAVVATGVVIYIKEKSKGLTQGATTVGPGQTVSVNVPVAQTISLTASSDATLGSIASGGTNSAAAVSGTTVNITGNVQGSDTITLSFDSGGTATINVNITAAQSTPIPA